MLTARLPAWVPASRPCARECRFSSFPRAGAPSPANLQEFLSGAAYLAIRAQVPLVPIALSGVYDLLPIHTHHLFPGELTLAVGEPIETTGMTPRQAKELTARLREAVESLRQAASTGAGEASGENAQRAEI